MENLSKDEIKMQFLSWFASDLSCEYNRIWKMSENCENYSNYYNHAYYKGYFEALENIGRNNGLKLKLHNGEWYFSIGK